MADPFASYDPGLTGVGDSHYQISASANDLDPKPRVIFCQAAGTLTIEDKNGVALPYDMAGGTWIPFRGHKVTAIASGTFYAWL